MDATKIMASNLTLARKEAGLSQAELADKLGYRRQTIIKCESGNKPLTIELIERWAAATGYVVRIMLIPESEAKPPNGAIG